MDSGYFEEKLEEYIFVSVSASSLWTTGPIGPSCVAHTEWHKYRVKSFVPFTELHSSVSYITGIMSPVVKNDLFNKRSNILPWKEKMSGRGGR